MLIAFEGIDGSGKTTLSNALAKRLKKFGLKVFHARENGELGSAISSQIRLITQSPANLALTPEAEFLLYAAREAQLLGEVVRPRLAECDVVICDRSLYTSLVLATYGRRLPRAQVEPILSWCSAGLWPELVFFCDVPIETSRTRKKIQKILDRRVGGGGRKGGAGLGLRQRLRQGYLELAQKEPGRWLRLDTSRLNPEEALEAAWSLLAPKLGLEAAPPIEPPPAPKLPAGSEERLRERYFAAVRRIAGRDARLAAYLLNGFDTLEAHELRELLHQKQPALVAYGLTGLPSAEAQAWRERLLPEEPHYVAYSLRGLFSEEALALRGELIERAPQGVALSLSGILAMQQPGLWPLRKRLAGVDAAAALLTLRGLDEEAAWELRARLGPKAPDDCLRSLAGLDSERAWALRQQLFAAATPQARAESLVGLDSDRAWEAREALRREAPVETLSSARFLASDRAFALRDRFFAAAPKPVIQGLGPLIKDDRAWKLREAALQDVMEVLESVRDLDDERAWALRERGRDIWPFAAISSLGVLARTPRGEAFIQEQLRRHPGDIYVAKHALRAALDEQRVGEE